ncbi:DNA polymerase III subunit alpha [bacterium]|nr:DNA polymerase III subunit alpha [bacterium]
MSSPEFVHLHVHSQFSLLDGVNHFGPLFEKVKSMGMDTVALTDHGNLFGACAFFKEAQEHEVRPIIGCEVYLSPTHYRDRTSNEARSSQHLVLLTKNYEGYLNLCYLVSKGFLEGFYYKPRIDKDLLAAHKEGLIALSGCLSGVVADYLQNDRPKEALKAAEDFARIMGPDHFYIELMDHGMPEQKKVNQQLLEIARETGLPVVATNDAHYLARNDSKTQDLLLAIGTGKTIDDQNRLRFDVAEFYLKSPEEMNQIFGHIEGAIENTVRIAERCQSEIRFRQALLPVFQPPDKSDPEDFLRRLVMEGLEKRYGEITPAIRDRYEHEMKIISGMGFVSYFLVVWDFVRYALERGIPTGCRGSGAGSIVAYALGITELDPIKYKLFFERFLNPERVSMPDFDIDICQVRRGEVIEYVRNKYGKENVAHIITFSTMKAKAAVRDVGRVMNLPINFVDRVAKLIPEGPKVTMEKALEESAELKELYDTDPQITEIINRAREIEGTVRQPGVHAAGVVVCSKPLIEAIPLYRQTNKEEVITQYNMNEVEELGLLKIDFLGLKNLTIIADCIALIREIHDVQIDWEKIGFDDPKTYELLQRGDGFGVFQVESSGMRDMLRRALPTNLEDITALIALYRPGPMQFMDSFINRKHRREDVTYPHPDMEEPLKETYGLMIYQEQVMQVASVLGGFSLGEADILRRAMSKKKAKEMEKMKAQFIEGCAKKDIPAETAEEIFAMIEKFASYGFNKAHAASYAVLTYRTGYLKAHYPAEFMAALLTGEIRTSASDKLGMYIGVGRDMGLQVLQPNINLSQAFFTVVNGDIRFGLVAIKNVGHGPVAAIIEERDKNGPFETFQDFCERIDQSKVGSRAIECLIVAGAFDSMGGTRPQLLAILPDALEIGNTRRSMKESGQTSLFDMLAEDDAEKGNLNSIPLPDIPDWTDREKFNREKELAGIFLSGHPLDRFRSDIRSFASATSADLTDKKDKDQVTVVGMVTDMREILTRNGDAMSFVTLEDLDGRYEVIFFPRTYDQNRNLLILDEMLYVEGKVSRRAEEDEPKVLVDRAIRLEDVRRERTRFIDIDLQVDDIDITQLESLRRLFRDNKGPIPTRLRLTWNGAEGVQILTDSRFRVTPSDAFLKDFDNLGFTTRLKFSTE